MFAQGFKNLLIVGTNYMYFDWLRETRKGQEGLKKSYDSVEKTTTTSSQ